MPTILGILGLADTDRTFVNVVGQRVVYDATMQYLDQYNAELNAAMSIFVERTTEDFKFRYKLPGGGRMQKRGEDARPGAIKASGYWDVAFPLEDWGDLVAGNDVALAYMRADEYNRHIQTVTIRDINTVRFEMLYALFNNTQRSFSDPFNGTLAIEPLANGDAVVYPPVVGSGAEATETHYLESGYIATAISDTNNPFVTIRDELTHHWGASQGGESIVVFINSAETAETEALTDFDPVNDRFVVPGANADQLSSIPTNLPGRVLGRTNGVWVSEWDYMPATYMVGVDMAQPRPLIQRVDPADTGLAQGLTLVAEEDAFPLSKAYFRHRYGFGVGNRLNGVVMELANGGGYTIPTAYA